MFNDKPIRRREGDGYFDATAMCKAVGKVWHGYQRLASTKAFVAALATDEEIHSSTLIQVTKGGKGAQGTWIHPQLAINLAQWCSPQFAVFVSKWVIELLTTGKVELKPAAPIAIAEPEPSLLAVLVKQTQQTTN